MVLVDVDVTGIDRKTFILPGEVSVTTGWYSGEVSRGHSRYSKRATIDMWMVSQRIEGPNVKQPDNCKFHSIVHNG